MYIKALNYIIAISLAGLAIFIAKDVYIAQTQQPVQYAQDSFAEASETSPTPDLPITCKHDFFNFNKGMSWTYSIESQANLSNQEATSSSTIATTEIVNVGPGYISTNTSFDGSDEVLTSSMTCLESGIYGLPIPLIPLIEAPNIPINPEALISDSLELLPPAERASWSSDLTNNIELPLIGNNVQLALLHSARNVSDDEMTVNVILDAPSIPVSTDEYMSMNYMLKKSVGLKSLNIDINLPSAGTINIAVKLEDFHEQAEKQPDESEF